MLLKFLVGLVLLVALDQIRYVVFVVDRSPCLVDLLDGRIDVGVECVDVIVVVLKVQALKLKH